MLTLGTMSLMLLASGIIFSAPDWWSIPGRSVLDPVQNQDNRAAVTVGQLKSIALRAQQAMNEQYSGYGGAGVEITAMIDGWVTHAATDEQNAAATVGQVKTVAKLFYDRLDELGVRSLSEHAYPWNNSVPAENAALATAGQLKTVFSFELEAASVIVLKHAGSNAGSTEVAEGTPGTGDSYTVALRKEPPPGVSVTVAINAEDDQVTVTPASLVFNSTNWNTPQPVTVNAVNDAVVEGGHEDSLVHLSSSTDPEFDGLMNSLSVDLSDDDAGSIVVTETGGATEVTEGGASDSYEIKLGAEPAGDVTVTLNGGAEVVLKEGGVPVSFLVFTPGNWNVARTITVTAEDDSLDESSPEPVTISHAASGGGYGSVSGPAIHVDVHDNEVPALSVATSLTVPEGGTANLVVKLNMQPASGYAVTFNAVLAEEGDADLTLGSLPMLELNGSNWNTGVSIPVLAAEDDDDVIPGRRVLHLDAEGAADVDVELVEKDDDLALVADAQMTAIEGAESVFRVRLNTRPYAAVTILAAFASSGDASLTLANGPNFTLDEFNWTEGVEIRIAAAADPDNTAGSRTLNISDTAVTPVVAPISATIREADDDLPAVLVLESGEGTSVTEGGSIDDYSLRLMTQPSAPVTVKVGGGGGQITFAPPSVTFTTANWHEPQKISVYALDDALVETSPHAAADLTHTVESGDGAYNGLSVASVDVEVFDNDEVPGPDPDADTNANGIPDGWEADHAGEFAVWPEALKARLRSGRTQKITVKMSNDTEASVGYDIAVLGAGYQETVSHDSVYFASAWEDISSTGTRLEDISDLGEGSQPVAVTGFTFPFYGKVYSQVHVNAKGFIAFDPDVDEATHHPLPASSMPSALIAPFWSDLRADLSGDVYVKEMPDHRLIVQYQNVGTGHGAGTYTFQVILHENGSIRFLYHTLGGTMEHYSAGIQNDGAVSGVQTGLNNGFLENSTVVDFQMTAADFFSVSANSGTVPSHTIGTFDVDFAPLGLSPGTYSAFLVITESGAGGGHHYRPVTLEVVQPQLVITAPKPAAGFVKHDGLYVTASVGTLVGVAKVEFYANDVKIGEEDAAVGGRFSYYWSPAVGNYSLRTRAYDKANNLLDLSDAVSCSVQEDSDHDDIGNEYEVANGLNSASDDSLEDKDGDRIPNLFEYKGGSLAGVFASTPVPDCIVDPALADASSTDNIFAGINEAIDRATSPYRIITVKSGTYEESINVGYGPVLLLAEQGGAQGPVEIRSPRGPALQIGVGALVVADGFILTTRSDNRSAGVSTQFAYRGRLVNCVIRGNKAAGIDNQQSEVDLVHCTITGNSSSLNGGAQGIVNREYTSNIRLINSIVWGNGPSGALQIAVGDGSVVIDHSIVEGGSSPALNTNPALTPAGWLRSTSAYAINQGDPMKMPALVDIHGEIRTGIPDLGADEYLDGNGTADGDGLPDWLEGASDDGDGLAVLDEYLLYGSSPLLADTDGDGVNDGAEISHSSDPLIGDTDHDGMPDGYEIAHGLTANVDDSLEDEDGDRVPNLFEFKRGTDPDDALEKPAADFIINPAQAALSGTDNIYASVADLPLGEIEPFSIIEFTSGRYEEDLALPQIPLLVLGQSGGPFGPPELRTLRSSPAAATVMLSPLTVFDGFVLTCWPGYAGVAVRAQTLENQSRRCRLVNCIIRGYSAEKGAAIYSDQGALIDVVHCTLSGNSSSVNGKAICNSAGGKITLINSIVWGNSGAAAESIYNTGAGSSIVVAPYISIISGGEHGGASVDPVLTPGLWTQAASAARNYAGITLAKASLVDIQGEARDADGDPDLGADEFRETTDADGLPDWLEGTPDSDGLTELDEFLLHGSNPLLADTDGDGAPDNQEVAWPGTPLKVLIPDTDGDGMPDGYEIAHGFNPLVNDADPANTDVDGDGMDDQYEEENGLNPFVNDSGLDKDGDGLSNLVEHNIGSKANEHDTDGDGLNDGWEHRHGLSVTVPVTELQNESDEDEDDLKLYAEEASDTDPENPDTDGDGYEDGDEVAKGSDPLDDESMPFDPTRFYGPDHSEEADYQPIGLLPGGSSVSWGNKYTVKGSFGQGGDLDVTAFTKWKLKVGSRSDRNAGEGDVKDFTFGLSPNQVSEISMSFLSYSTAKGMPGAEKEKPPTYYFGIKMGDPSYAESPLNGFVYVDPSWSYPAAVGGMSVESTNQDWKAYLIPYQTISQSNSYFGAEATGPRYRKVSLAGRPIPDQKPEQEEETETLAEETYVDAYDLALHHDTSYVHVPLAASDLVLEANASVRGAHWTDRGGLRPNEELTSPFGVGWSSNLCSYVEVVQIHGKASDDPFSVNVVDEAGRSQRFGTKDMVSYFPWSSSRVDKKTYLNTLEKVGNTFVLKKKYGHTLVYAPTSAWFAYSSDRVSGGDSLIKHNYWRLVSVTDRYGNKLLYDYGDNAVSLIPRLIYAPASSDADEINDLNQWIAINRSPNGRRILSLTDSRGESTRFNYTPLSVYGHECETLTKVTHSDGLTTGYAYSPVADAEHSGNTTTVHYHVDLESITDGAGGKHSFTYAYDRTKYSSSASSSYYSFAVNLNGLPGLVADYAQRKLDSMNEDAGGSSDARLMYGLPRMIRSVTMPDTSVAEFGKTPGTHLLFGSTLSGSSGTYVKDAEGKLTFYEFAGLEGEIVDVDNDTSNGFGSISTSTSTEWMLYYKTMSIHHGAADSASPDYLGTELYEFDLASGLGLKRMVDMSGNETTWEYADDLGLTGWTGVRPPFQNPFSSVMTAWADPTKKTDALGRTETYVYSDDYRIMKESVDVHGTKTETVVDALGRRKSMVVTGPGGGKLKEETYLYDDEDGGTVSATAFPGFMVEKKVKAFDSVSGQDWEKDLVTHYVPDNLRRIAQEIVDPGPGVGKLALTTHYSYDLNNNKLSVTNPLGNTTRFSYDERNRLTRVTHPVAGTSTGDRAAYARYVYNQRGNRAVIVDEEGRYTIHRYDELGRLVQTVKDMDGKLLPALPSTEAHQWLAASRLGGINADADLVTSFQYNKVGSVIKATDPKGIVTQTFYDALQRPAHVYGNFSATDANVNGSERGKVVRNSTQKTHTEYVYDLDKNSGASGLEPRGFKPTTVIRHHVVKSNSDALKTLTDHYEYDGVYREIVRKTQFNPDVTTSSGQAQSTTLYGSGTLVANKEALLTQVTDPRGKITKTTLDGLGRKVQTVDAFGTSLASTTSQLYSSTGLAFQSTDPLGRITETEFDSAGRQFKVWQPDPGTGLINRQAQDDLLTGSPLTVTEYDEAGNVTATINPRGHRTDFDYDARNRKTREEGPAVLDATLAPGQPAVRPVSQVAYNGVGKVISTIDPRFATTVTQYDRADRPTHSLTPAVSVHGLTGLHILTTVTEYDKNGNVTRVTDAAGNRTVNFYDNLNRLTTTATNPVTGQPSTSIGSPTTDEMRVTNEYDDAGNKTLVTDANGAQTAFRYDGLARNTKIIWDPGKARSQSKTTVFDALVQTSRTDESDQVTTYLYDALHRQKDIQYAGRSMDNRHTVYDLVGNVLDVTYPNDAGSVREVHQTFDKLNRLVTESSAGVTHAYQYDKAGNRRVTTYGQTGRQLLSTYDAYNRLLTCTEDARVTEYGYDLTGNIARHLLPNGVKVTRTFDLLNRQISATHLVTGGTDPFSINTYSYDKSGNNRQIQEDYPAGNLSSRTVLNTYDKVYRLDTEVQTTTGSGTVTTVYGYDKGNNRTSKTVTGGSTPGQTTYLYGNGITGGNSNQLITQTRPDASVVTYTYDDRGNRTTRTEGGDTDTYSYDYENRLLSLDYETGAADTGLYNYHYDHRTRRVVRDESAVSGRALTLLSFSGGTSVQEHTSTVSATPAVEYLRGSDYGGGIGGILYTLKAGAATFNHYNSRGDVIARTDGSGDLAYQAQYEAYGKRTAESGTNTDRQTANTKDEDPTGLLNEGFRYRDLETGSFITRDPGGFVDGPNLYTYVQQNPWSKSDPEGLFWSALLTVASAAYDTYQYANGNMSGADYARSMIVNGAALAADVVTGGQGGGMLVRAAALSCKAKSAIVAGAKMVEKADNIISTVESAAGAMESISEGNYGAAAMQVGSALMTGKASASKIDTPSFCFAAGTGVWQGSGTASIETLRVGQRIIADLNEGTAPTETLTGEWLEVEMTFEDPFGWGRLCRATLLRPADHVAAKEWREGAQVPMHFGEEVEARDGLATVVRVTKAPQVETGIGRVVTSTFQTWNADLRELWMEGLEKPILVTGGHRFYSETRGEWVRVHDFLLGEKIRSLDGDGRSVLEVRQVPGVHAVFNMEIEGLHQYHVSSAGLLTHNTGDCKTAKDISTANDKAVGAVRNAENGVDFSNSPHLYPTGPGQSNIVSIEYTGTRGEDFGVANAAAGISNTQKVPQGFVWHHLDDYDAKTNTGTMQLITQKAHKATYTHVGGVAQYEKAHGIPYDLSKATRASARAAGASFPGR